MNTGWATGRRSNGCSIISGFDRRRSGITNDPNRADDPQYILRLIGQVITVSLETVKIVRELPPLGLADSSVSDDSGS